MPQSERLKVCVVGAGITGLCTALQLVKDGCQVTIRAEHLGGQDFITSSAAAAFWYPFWVGKEPDHSWYRSHWALDTFRALAEISTTSPAAGIFRTTLAEYFPDNMGDELVDRTIDGMWWRNLPEFNFEQRSLTPPFAFLEPFGQQIEFSTGITFGTFVVNMNDYLPYLLKELTASPSVDIQKVRLPPHSLPEQLRDHDFVVNCAGLGAHDLVPDPRVQPREGLVLRLAPIPGLTDIFLVHTGDPFSGAPLYVVPRKGREDDIVVGGTVGDQKGPEEAKPQYFEWREVPDKLRTEALGLLDANEGAVPELHEAEIIGVAVGYRPSRLPDVRLEPDWENPRIIHNYGHGGGGITLSWGCAFDVSAWMQRIASA